MAKSKSETLRRQLIAAELEAGAPWYQVALRSIAHEITLRNLDHPAAGEYSLMLVAAEALRGTMEDIQDIIEHGTAAN